jgi:hypothetical protein
MIEFQTEAPKWHFKLCRSGSAFGLMLFKTAQAAQAALPQRLSFLQTAVLIGSAGSLGRCTEPRLLLLLPCIWAAEAG